MNGFVSGADITNSGPQCIGAWSKHGKKNSHEQCTASTPVVRGSGQPGIAFVGKFSWLSVDWLLLIFYVKERESIDYSIKITTDMALNGEVFINNLISGDQRINIHCWIKLDESDKLNRLQGEWEFMQMASMIFFTRCYFLPIIWHLICSMCVESIWHTFNWFWNLIVVQGHAKQLLQAKNVFPKSEVFLAKS